MQQRAIGYSHSSARDACQADLTDCWDAIRRHGYASIGSTHQVFTRTGSDGDEHWREAMRWARETGSTIVVGNARHVSASQLEEARAAGIRVITSPVAIRSDSIEDFNVTETVRSAAAAKAEMQRRQGFSAKSPPPDRPGKSGARVDHQARVRENLDRMAAAAQRARAPAGTRTDTAPLPPKTPPAPVAVNVDAVSIALPADFEANGWRTDVSAGPAVAALARGATAAATARRDALQRAQRSSTPRSAADARSLMISRTQGRS